MAQWRALEGEVPRHKLSAALFGRERGGFTSIAALPSNHKAIEACLRFSAGADPFVVLVGPCGWGKTHLLSAVSATMKRESGIATPVDSAIQWISTPPSRFDGQAPLILDDVQDVHEKSRPRQQLRSVLERRVRGGKPTLLSITSPRWSRAYKSLIPFAREWIVAPVLQPESKEKELIVRQMALAEGLILAPAILHLLAYKTVGNGRTLGCALRRLHLIQTGWTSPKQILRALGILYPHLHDERGWDLRDHVFEVIFRCMGTDFWPCQGISNQDLCVYIMIEAIGLGEKEVASFFRIEPGAVYGIAGRMKREHIAGHLDVPFNYCSSALLASLARLS